MADPGLSEIVTSTLRDRSKVIADNTTNNNAILRRLNKRGNIKYWNGGRTIVQELDYAGNNTYTRYSGADVLDISPQTVLTAAEFQPKQAAVSVNITGLEELQNTGPNAVLDLLEARIRNAERTMENGLTADMYSSGTAAWALSLPRPTPTRSAASRATPGRSGATCPTRLRARARRLRLKALAAFSFTGTISGLRPRAATTLWT